MIFPFIIYGILWTLVWRYWLVYYDIKFARSTSHSKWKSILNPKNDQQAWFIVNKSTFGNIKWTFIFCIFSWLISSLISFIFHLIACLEIYSQRMATLLDSGLNILPFILLYIIWLKTPKFEDKFWIRYELKITIYAYITLFIWYFLGNIIAALFKMDEFLFNFISSWIVIIITALFVYLCTRWILNLFVFAPNLSDWNSLSASNSRSVTLSNSNIIQQNNGGILLPKQSLSVKSISETGSSLKLYELLRNNDGLNCFMDHLIYEFSHECLLSFIEMVQWKTTLNQKIMDNLDIFKHQDIEQIIIINQHLKILTFEKNMNASLDLTKKYSISLSRNSNLLSPQSLFNQSSQERKSKSKSKSSPSLQPQASNDQLSIPSFQLKKDSSMIDIRSSSTDSNSNFNYKLHILLFQFPDKIPLSSIVANMRYWGDIFIHNDNNKHRTNNIIIGSVDDDDDDDDDDESENEMDKLNDADDEMIDDDDMDESVLRHEKKIIYDYKMKAYGLFQRYVYDKNGCDMEINIHYGTRNKLIKLMNDLNKWIENDNIFINDLYILFDECIEEMYRLMKDSFKRFKQTQEFIKLDKEIFSAIKRIN